MNNLQNILSSSLSASSPSLNLKQYNLNFKYTGLALMIINYEFSDPQNNFPPEGYNPDLDIESFSTLENFNFQIIVYRNQTRDQIEGLINDCVNFDYSEYGCCFLCISSHGDEKSIYSCDQEKIDREEEIIERFFQSESLKNKPKIFLFDCCRGNYTMIAKSLAKNDNDLAKGKKYLKVHDTNNFFIGYAAVKKFKAHIHPIAKRSNFIWAFFDVLKSQEKIEWDRLKIATAVRMKENNCFNPPVFEGVHDSILTFVKNTKTQEQKLIIQQLQQQKQQLEATIEQQQRENKQLNEQLKKEITKQENLQIENERLIRNDQIMQEQLKNEKEKHENLKLHFEEVIKQQNHLNTIRIQLEYDLKLEEKLKSEMVKQENLKLEMEKKLGQQKFQYEQKINEYQIENDRIRNKIKENLQLCELKQSEKYVLLYNVHKTV